VPIATTRLGAVLDFLRLDADGRQKPSSDPVCSNEAGESLKYFRSASGREADLPRADDAK